MAIARVTCTCVRCGCEFEHRATRYSRRDADSYEKWAAENITVCPACWRAEQEEKKRREMDETIAPYAPLSALMGSEKQIAWAEKLRAGFIAEVERYIAPTEEVQPEKVTRCRDALRALLEWKTECRWWIDTRDESFLDRTGQRRNTLREILKEMTTANQQKEEENSYE